MPLTWVAVTALAAACAPTATPSTLAAVAKVESGFDPLAIGINGSDHRQIHPATLQQAVATASRLIGAGRNIDLGLAQINSGNLMRLGLSIDRAFDPCTNLAASGRVLQAAYTSVTRGTDGQDIAVLKALSLYNTGDAWRGFRNGYVAKVTAAAGKIVPALQPAPAQTTVPPAPPAWDVFARARPSAAGFVLSPAGMGDRP